jgi:hypothetical protein
MAHNARRGKELGSRANSYTLPEDANNESRHAVSLRVRVQATDIIRPDKLSVVSRNSKSGHIWSR